MCYMKGVSGPSLLIESTESLIAAPEIVVPTS